MQGWSGRHASRVRLRSTWPPRSRCSRRRDPYAGGRVQRVRCQLKTTGGNCAQLVQQTLGELLRRVGLPPHFYFDGDQFRPRAPPRPRVVPKPPPKPRSPGGAGGWVWPEFGRGRLGGRQARRVTCRAHVALPRLPAAPAAKAAAEPTPAEVEAIRARAAKAGFPSQTITEQQFKEMEAQSVRGARAY